jgi:hypothetical protein
MMSTPAKHTHAVRLFSEMVRAVRAGIPMKPRSANDKEYFAQDWFIDRIRMTGLQHQQQGRNSYPDFWVYDSIMREGFEIKSLAFVQPSARAVAQGQPGKPARKDLDFNSTIPSGRKSGHDVFLVFFLYTGSGAAPRAVHSLSLAHADLLNADHDLADRHLNIAIKQFGSYGDGFIRNRKMYVFPHPITIDPSGLGRCRLILPSDWECEDPALLQVGAIQRTVASQALTSYTVNLHGGKPTVRRKPCADAGCQWGFRVFEPA